MNSSPYTELNIPEGSSLTEIKAAYRKLAKSCHPDSGAGKGDPARFSRASAAYRSLCKEVMGALRGEPAEGLEPFEGIPEGASYRFIGRKSSGLDDFYDLQIRRPAGGGGVEVDLPWTRKEACPRCLGQGETLRRNGGGFVFKPSACPRCKGKGYVEDKRVSRVLITAEMLAKGRVRVSGAGGYLPREGRRGDLVLNIRVVDAMPRVN
jgi:molecular chaperone DnaJ